MKVLEPFKANFMLHLNAQPLYVDSTIKYLSTRLLCLIVDWSETLDWTPLGLGQWWQTFLRVCAKVPLNYFLKYPCVPLGILHSTYMIILIWVLIDKA